MLFGEGRAFAAIRPEREAVVLTEMLANRRDRLTGTALIAALAGSFAVVAASLARAGICICSFRLTWHGVQVLGDPDRASATFAAGSATACRVRCSSAPRSAQAYCT